MHPKMLQYLMGHSNISVMLNTYTHLGLGDATDELKRMEELVRPASAGHFSIFYTTTYRFMLKYHSSSPIRAF